MMSESIEQGQGAHMEWSLSVVLPQGNTAPCWPYDVTTIFSLISRLTRLQYIGALTTFLILNQCLDKTTFNFDDIQINSCNGISDCGSGKFSGGKNY